MKKEYIEKLAELKAIEARTPEEEAFFVALVDLEAKEKLTPFDKVAFDEAKKAAEEAGVKA